MIVDSQLELRNFNERKVNKKITNLPSFKKIQ